VTRAFQPRRLCPCCGLTWAGRWLRRRPSLSGRAALCGHQRAVVVAARSAPQHASRTPRTRIPPDWPVALFRITFTACTCSRNARGGRRGVGMECSFPGAEHGQSGNYLLIVSPISPRCVKIIDDGCRPPPSLCPWHCAPRLELGTRSTHILPALAHLPPAPHLAVIPCACAPHARSSACVAPSALRPA